MCGPVGMIPLHVAVALVRVFRAAGEPDTSVNVVSAKASASASFERELHHWISQGKDHS